MKDKDRIRTASWAGVALAAALVAAGAAPAAVIDFSGQLAPGLATIDLNGGDGSFDGAGAPNFVQLIGSDTGTETSVLTTATWSMTAAIADLSFFWVFQTFDVDGPSFDPAGYFVNANFVQLSDDSGSNLQQGFVSGLNLAVGDTFGFWVDATDDDLGRAQITISNQVVPEPGSAVLFGLGAAALLALRRKRS